MKYIFFWLCAIPVSFIVTYVSFVANYVPQEPMCMTEDMQILPCDYYENKGEARQMSDEISMCLIPDTQ